MLQEPRGGARSFVRSLNILLKFARLYEFGHAKTSQQFETTWKELRNALDDSSGGGVLLGASGTQILLDGVPLGSAAGERSFAHLLTSSGIASIHFSPTLTQPQFARFVRAFPSGNAKPSSLAEQLKTALAGESSIKVNEIRYVAEDSSVAGIKVAAQLTQKVLGAAGDKFKDFFEDPNKMLQMILAAESMRSGGGWRRRNGWWRGRYRWWNGDRSWWSRRWERRRRRGVARRHWQRCRWGWVWAWGGGLEPAAGVVRERALVVVAPEAAAQVAVGTEVVEEQDRGAEAEGLEPAGELEVQAGKAQRRENG